MARRIQEEDEVRYDKFIKKNIFGILRKVNYKKGWLNITMLKKNLERLKS